MDKKIRYAFKYIMYSFVYCSGYVPGRAMGIRRHCTLYSVLCGCRGLPLVQVVVYPLLRFTASIGRPCKETFSRRRTFSSALGCGNVLFGRFPFFSPSCPSVSYSFISLFYIPLIPTGCYDLSGTGKSLLPIDTEQFPPSL